MTRVLARLSLCLALGGLACVTAEATATTQPEDASADAAAVEAARAFQVDYERELRDDPRSFLTTIAAHYLGVGEHVVLTLRDGAWIEADEPDAVVFVVRDDALVVRTDDWETIARESTIVPVGEDDRFSFGVSRQGEDWRVLVHDRDAPLRTGFPGIAWFPVDATRIVSASFEPEPARTPKSLQTSRGTTKTVYLAGRLRFVLADRELELLAFAYAPEAAPGEPWLVPFRDATSGAQTYAAGRYLELVAPAAGEARVVLDFNRAINPLCAYSEHYNCPMPPSFNRLELAIEAGARAPEH